jgi:hypothetical protein
MFALFQFLCGDVYIFPDLLNKRQSKVLGCEKFGLKTQEKPK